MTQFPRSVRPLWVRRDVLKTAAGTAAAVLSGLPTRASALIPRDRRRLVSALDPTLIIDETNVRALALQALDAAKSAGASYADVRLTRELTQRYHTGSGGFMQEAETFGIGIRVFVNGYSGFTASPYWDAVEVGVLARAAVAQAKANARVMPQATMDWARIPVASGSWATPVKIDPFVVPVEEKGDLLWGWCDLARSLRGATGTADATFTRQERAVATTDGAYFTQTQYQSTGRYTLQRDSMRRMQYWGEANATGLETTPAGWELFYEADLPRQLAGLYAQADPDRPSLVSKPGDVGRYMVVCDAGTMASLVSATVARAAQLDRALGYEANAGGTSYLGPDPLALLGTFQAASPLVTVTANRSMRRGLATVKWDDEGVEPEDFTLIKDGVLVDYQTTREQAPWLAPYYQKIGKPIRSHGCAAAPDARSITMQHRPNLVLEPGSQDVAFSDLVADVKRGLAILDGGVDTDFQARRGSGIGRLREIINGKLGATIGDLEFIFDSTQLWKEVKALGGAKSARQFAAGEVKGQPKQAMSHSVRAVPALLANVSFVRPPTGEH